MSLIRHTLTDHAGKWGWWSLWTRIFFFLLTRNNLAIWTFSWRHYSAQYQNSFSMASWHLLGRFFLSPFPSAWDPCWCWVCKLSSEVKRVERSVFPLQEVCSGTVDQNILLNATPAVFWPWIRMWWRDISPCHISNSCETSGNGCSQRDRCSQRTRCWLRVATDVFMSLVNEAAWLLFSSASCSSNSLTCYFILCAKYS